MNQPSKLTSMTGKPLIYIMIMPILIFQLGCSQPKTPRIAYASQPIDQDRVIQAARQQLGTEYKFGGQSPREGFDCSGLVYYSFKQAGVALPRTAYEQLKGSRPVSKRHLEPSDLVFFRITRSRISHVGIYLGNNRFIHAPSTGKLVSIARLDSPYWQRRFIRAGRVQGPAMNRNRTY